MKGLFESYDSQYDTLKYTQALVLQDLPSVEVIAMELDSVKLLNNDLEAILSTIYDEIIVVDARGKLLRASDHYISSQWNRPPNTLIGLQLLKLKKADKLLYKVMLSFP